MTRPRRFFSGIPLLVMLMTLFTAPYRVCAGEEELDVDDIPLAIADAEVGEWVLYRLADGKRSRLTVVEKWVEGEETFLRIVNEITNGRGKKPRYSEEVVEVGQVVDDLRSLGPEDRINESEILLHGRKLDVVVVSYYDNGKLVRQSYLSEAIPVYGLVRGVNPNAKVKTALSLVDYGFAEDD